MGLIITLMLLGVLLIIIELVLIPGIFITGIIGLGALVGANLHAFKIYGNTGGIIVVLITIIIVCVALFFALRAKTWRALSLKTEIDSKTDNAPEEKGLKKGDIGETLTRLSPSGKVLFGNQTVEANVRNGMIDPNKQVEIINIEDNKIFVKLKNE